MIQIIENRRDEIINSREGTNSTTAKSSNENTPNIHKKSLPISNKINIPKIPSKNDIKNFENLTSDGKAINIRPTGENINILDKNKSSNFTKEQNNKKDFVEKKRRRRNRCSYSKSRNKKSKKRNIIQQFNHPLNNIVLNKELICQSICLKNESNIDLQVENNKENEKNIDKACNTSNEKTKSDKKKAKIDKKEIISNAEKEFMDNLNKKYSDEQFNKDLEMNLKEKKAQFMKENFPIMYRKDKYYLYTVLLKKRRTQPINFIQPNTLFTNIQEFKKYQTLYLNEEPEQSEYILSENTDQNKNENIKNKNNPINQNSPKNQKSKDKKNLNIFEDSGIIPSINKKNDKNNKCKKEVEKIKLDLTIPRKPIQDKNNKKGNGLSDTSQSDHDTKNLDINHLIDDFEEKNKDNKKGLKYKKVYNLLPKQIWSLPNDKTDLDIDMFYDDCIQIWPFEECIFVKEIALEFLMKNNYSAELCLKRIQDFVSFMKKRAEELNISIINKNEKTVKKYSLRNTKNK